MKLGGYVYQLPDAEPVAAASVRLVGADGATVAQTATGADGAWGVEQAGFSPLAFARVAGRGTSRAVSVDGGGQCGPFSMLELPPVLRALGDGVLPAVGGGLAVSRTDQAARTLSVAAGAALVAGFPFAAYAATALTLDAVAGQPRIDTVVVRVNPLTGASALAVVKGTEAASPAAPALANTATSVEAPLADVTVTAGGAGEPSDRRTLLAYTTSAAPTLVGIGRAGASLALSTALAGVAVGGYVNDAAVAVSLTPAAGVAYDVRAAYAHAVTASGGGEQYGTALEIAGATGGEVRGPYTARGGLRNAHAASLVGDGTPKAFGVRLIKRTATQNATLAARTLTVVAVPRSRT